MSEVMIAGLPGCGKSRWIAAQPDSARFVEWRWGEKLPENTPVWMLIDLRGDPEAVLPHLEPFLEVSDAFLGVFAEEVDIFRQKKWREIFKVQNFRGTPLHFSHFMNRPATLAPEPVRRPAIQLQLPALARFRITLPQVVLEHLLFVLQGLQMSTPMRFWRVKGCLNTLEYANAVAVEGSLAGLFTHAAERADGVLTLWVENPQPQALQEALQAALAPGHDMDIALNPE